MNEEAELGAETTPVPSRADADPETTPVPSRADADLLGLRSIQFRTWLSFVMLTAITLIVLWGAQIVFYNATFREMTPYSAVPLFPVLPTASTVPVRLMRMFTRP